MARGYTAKETVFKDRAIDIMSERASRKQLSESFDVLSNDSSARESMGVLADILYKHVMSTNSNADANRENKLKIVKLFEALPDRLKNIFSLPRETADTLWRGIQRGRVPVPSNTVKEWKEGGYVYSFSGSKDMAERFTLESDTQARIINATEAVESFKGIIDVSRVIEVVKAYDEFAKKSGINPIPHSSRFEIPTEILDWRGEREVLMYGIKFKPTTFTK